MQCHVMYAFVDRKIFLYGRYFESIMDIENAINSYLKSINIAKKDEDKTLALNALGLIYLKDKNVHFIEKHIFILSLKIN